QGAALHRRRGLVAGRADRPGPPAPEAGAAARAIGAVLMHLVRLHRPNDFDEWRRHARGLIAAGIAPADIAWRHGDDEDELFDEGELLPVVTRSAGTVPRLFIERAQLAIQHSDPVRFSLLYRLLWRQRYANHLLDDATDKDNSLLTRLVSGVRRDSHKMKAFVRFRKVVDGAGKARFLAWFEPEHFTLEATAPFFARRF